jgi:hypothetical protein
LGHGRYISREAMLASGAEVVTELLRAEGAQHAMTDAAACLELAARIHGFEFLGQPPKRMQFVRDAAPGRTPWDTKSVRVLVARLPTEHLTVVGGLLITSPARTVVDIARNRPRRAAVVAADSALRLGVRRDELERIVDDCRGWPGVRRARWVVEFADELAESALDRSAESRCGRTTSRDLVCSTGSSTATD